MIGDTVRLQAPATAASTTTTTPAPVPSRMPLLLVLGALVVAAVFAAIAWTRAPKPVPGQPTSAGSAATPAPAPARGNSGGAKDNAPTAARPEAPRQFACSDLPFGLRVTCTLEGKEVIRKCAPDLKRWDNERPGCKRQSEPARSH